MSTFTPQQTSPNFRAELDNAQTIERLTALRDAYAWGVRTEDDNILRLHFGAPHLVVQEPSSTAQLLQGRRIVIATGQWHLIVFDGEWEIETGTLKLTRQQLDEGSTEAPTRCLSNLSGQKLTSIDWHANRRVWVFSFDLGGKLSVRKDRSASTDKDAFSEWTMFFADGGSLSSVGDDKCLWEYDRA